MGGEPSCGGRRGRRILLSPLNSYIPGASLTQYSGQKVYLRFFLRNAIIYSFTIDSHPMLARSLDGGAAWRVQGPVDAARPEILPKPIPAPLELSTGLSAADNGTYLLTCSTWKDWAGNCPLGHKVLLAFSANLGRDWTGTVDIFSDSSGRFGYWERRVIPVAGEKMLATCWAHDWCSEKDLPNHFALSHNRGRIWTVPAPAPIMGQTGCPTWLGNDTILFAYNHRRKPVGVRAQIVRVNQGLWQTLHDGEIWSPENKTSGTIRKDEYGVTGFQFGDPSAIRLAGGDIMVVYWCVEEQRAGINWTSHQCKKPLRRLMYMLTWAITGMPSLEP